MWSNFITYMFINVNHYSSLIRLSGQRFQKHYKTTLQTEILYKCSNSISRIKYGYGQKAKEIITLMEAKFYKFLLIVHF